MLHAAHASAYHWAEAPECEPKNRARSEWQVSRAYCVLGRAEPALHHARRCLELSEANADNLEEWDLPFAHEALARAHALGGNASESREHLAKARELAASIADPEDREHLEEALADLDR